MFPSGKKYLYILCKQLNLYDNEIKNILLELMHQKWITKNIDLFINKVIKIIYSCCNTNEAYFL